MKPKILTTLPGYSRTLLAQDVLAGVTVAMVALPLSLAIAIASGADPAKGLVTAIVAGFLISLLGGSRVQIGGPTGAFIVVVFGVIADHGYDGLVLATLMAGLILLVAGFFRAGNLIRLIPEPVINGFTIGIAVIIATSQLKDLLGLAVTDLPADFLPKVEALWAARPTVSGASATIGVVTMALIVLFRRAAPKWPGLIVAVALTSAIVAFTGLPVDTIASRFGDLPGTLPWPALPVVSIDRLIELLPSALVIAFLAGVESLLSAMVADRMIAGHHRPNAELLAQGAANIGSSLFGGMPATGAIARTATNIRAGGKTPVAGLVHAVTILVVMLVAAPLVGYMAMPALAGLLILTAWNMSEPHKWRGHLAERASDIFLLALTMVLTVLADLTVAIGVGVALGLALRLHRRNVPASDWSDPDR
ncbi:SulP family inorganic anion transporter [Roseovarius atlanticus]|uniref:SulP family inorganic anion transporter n=1 Tax=Roseovarius atlanticus TaxID=1641875 RepID=UPI001C93BFEA|nr:SulP family inorganic anion transporter [Roseovarius atlanticus]MBY5989428.1 SulP family inorganic anion transporter [Roseovarius atlanticus]MBY6124820.1 SulP family inorganic anion transporter [Roseovarius atlanticus]MBY6149315.1 SulP family inorganic anion transporter [Roseovarius atlanticus]